ncbi:hypothetical protein SEA_SYDNAT_17 [Mycobacterium phage SydNat]|uniref:Head-to-tail connector protein n=1 Tax=Mycobacterium phage Zolita TaxID=2593355 RepID=A0A514U2B8_9CAUD|nr:tail completion or Neck1 protein [Mycobacterium phage Zolita]QDK03101.1 hypothetical protein SEA_ZOLITA_16 [Mycobacterium phage Zolita]UVK64237.1 hypothetical protein SEA_SYDNAT_17 [Mycobacterium phage SydNat]UVK64323.1 hypothetical protein SEA_GHOULBOY_17 [Mycobacterium phage Ghoulboy]
MTIRLRRPAYVNGAAVRHVKTQRGLDAKMNEIFVRAEANLERARASTPHEKISGPEHVTKIYKGKAPGKHGQHDRIVGMSGTNPWAIEFGHGPSGFFSPGRYGKVTKAPHGLYILTRASFRPSTNVTPASGRRVGKR